MSALTIDEQLIAFLDRWEATRAALVTKHRLAAEHYQNRPTMRVCYDAARRSQAHYEHEVAMLRELRARALSP